MFCCPTQYTEQQKQAFRHPPAPALAAGADVAAPPSAVGAEASGAAVAKASEVCAHPSREVEVEQEEETKR